MLPRCLSHYTGCDTQHNVPDNWENTNKNNVVTSENNYGRFLEYNTCIEPKNLESSVYKSKKRKVHAKSTGKDKHRELERSTQSPEKQCPYELSSIQLKTADDRACNIRVPQGFGCTIFSKSTTMKSHDWKQVVSQGILKYCLRGILGENQRRTLFQLLDSMQEICNEKLSLDDLNDIEMRLNKTMALLERVYPITLQNITTHILHHVIDGIRRFGPIYGTWMFVFVRFNSWICKRALYRSHPENSAIETYIIFEWCQFMMLSGKAGTCTPISDLNKLDSELEHDVEGDPDMHIYTCVKKSCKITLGKRQLDYVHKQINIVACSNCTFIRKSIQDSDL